MSGIGNAFIWAAIGCGPLFLLVLAVAAAEKKIRTARPVPVRAPAKAARRVRVRNITDERRG